MFYDLSNELAKNQFKVRCNALYKKGGIVELKEKKIRTLGQNSYLHAIVGAVALETGVDIDYCKLHYFKIAANKDLFIVQKQDTLLGEVRDIRSSASLTKEEMSLAIDRFKKWASEQGIYLPEPGDAEILAQIEYELSRAQRYM